MWNGFGNKSVSYRKPQCLGSCLKTTNNAQKNDTAQQFCINAEDTDTSRRKMQGTKNFLEKVNDIVFFYMQLIILWTCPKFTLENKTCQNGLLAVKCNLFIQNKITNLKKFLLKKDFKEKIYTGWVKYRTKMFYTKLCRFLCCIS